MKAWLPVLLDNLQNKPVLALSTIHNLARAALFDQQGNLLAGGLGSPSLLAQAAEEARLMEPGDCRILPNPIPIIMERFVGDEEERHFWETGQANQNGAWASWLLTIPQVGPEGLRLARHLLSAFGPWTTPRLPQEFQDQWCLLPLRAGLGRLFVFGDDALAMETAALAARTGLTVTWLTIDEQKGPELDEARLLGDFELLKLDRWSQIDQDYLEDIGLVEGVKIMVSTPDPTVPEALTHLKSSHMTLAGEAETDQQPGLFAKPVTTAQNALGLIGAMLSH